jgi:hypothetical protein
MAVSFIGGGNRNTWMAFQKSGCHGRDRKLVGFTTTYAIGAYHH